MIFPPRPKGIERDQTVHGKFCQKCNCETKRSKSGKCKKCEVKRVAAWDIANPGKSKARAAAWYAENKNRAKARDSEYRVKNSKTRSEKNKIYRDAHKEKVRLLKRAWAKRNSKKCSAATARYRAAHPDRWRAQQSAWAAKNPELLKIKNQNYRAKKRANGGVISKGLATKLFKLQKGKCPCCNQQLGKDYQMDHIMPIALGGSNTDDNIQLLRAICNKQKSSKHPIEFMQGKGYLI